VINPSNHHVLLPHLACAAYELPLTMADEQWWGDDLDDGVRALVLADRLKVRRRRAFWAGRGSPAWEVGLRSGSSEEYRIADADGRAIGTVDAGRAFSVVHPGAVYLHQGQAFRVTDLDQADRVATVVAVGGEETTQARSETDIRVFGTEARTVVGRSTMHLGPVEVCQQVTGYQRRDTFTGDVLANVELDLPPSRLLTRAVWWTLTPATLAMAGIEPGRWPGTLHAVEHAAIGMLPLFTICDRWDVGGVSTALQADTGLPTIVIYDGYPGGAGIAELGYAAGARLLAATLELVRACPCAAGCPSCVQSPKCGNLNEPLDKAGAESLLAVLLADADTAGGVAATALAS
jgi:DEAD/DEAH box helicase domain-containing protein